MAHGGFSREDAIARALEALKQDITPRRIDAPLAASAFKDRPAAKLAARGVHRTGIEADRAKETSR